MAEKCKSYEIYQRMCAVYGKGYWNILSRIKMFTSGLNMSLQLQALVEKTVHGVKTQWFSGKENVLGAVVSKEGYADSFLGHERTYQYWFP